MTCVIDNRKCSWLSDQFIRRAISDRGEREGLSYYSGIWPGNWMKQKSESCVYLASCICLHLLKSVCTSENDTHLYNKLLYRERGVWKKSETSRKYTCILRRKIAILRKEYISIPLIKQKGPAYSFKVWAQIPAGLEAP